ncbi:flavoprotein [Kribbella deserti]|uniref:Flavoprotein n=1 Tax=Kribbella deserti TaxID=1926257 RepID=A0ABV6QVU2_9ACTN
MSEARTLYLVACGAGPASDVAKLVELAQLDGWTVQVLATQAAVDYFVDLHELERISGRIVRTTYQQASDSPVGKPDAVIVAPATYNTINKWAHGIADNYVLSQLAELSGLGVSIVALPFVNQALAANPVFIQSVAMLRSAGIRVLFGPGEFEPHPPRTGGEASKRFPWSLALAAATRRPNT